MADGDIKEISRKLDLVIQALDAISKKIMSPSIQTSNPLTSVANTIAKKLEQPKPIKLPKIDLLKPKAFVKKPSKQLMSTITRQEIPKPLKLSERRLVRSYHLNRLFTLVHEVCRKENRRS